MSPAIEHLLESAMALSEDERLQFIDALLGECDQATGRPFDDAWLVEAQKRSAQIDAGAVVLTPWVEVKRRVRERLEGRGDG